MKSFVILVLIVCSITITGCLDWNIHIAVNQDGSGLITETTIIPIASPMAEGDDTFVLDSIKKSAVERFGAVDVKDFKENKEKGKIIRVVHYSFKNINDVYMNMMGSDVSKEQYPYRFRYTSNNNGTHSLAVIADSTRFNSYKEGMEADDANMPSKETRKMALNMVKGFKFHFSLSTETPIKNTNAVFTKNNTVEFIDVDLYNITKLSYDNKQFRKTMKYMNDKLTPEQTALMKKHKFIVETQNVVNITY